MHGPKEHTERRLRRLVGMSPDKLEAMHKAAGSTMWWGRCWNCKRPSSRTRDEFEVATCPHCGVNLWKRT